MALLLRPPHKLLLVRFLTIIPLIIAGLLYFSHAYGASLPQRSILISDARAGVTGEYTASFTIPAPETLGSIKLEVCDNSPIDGDACNAPVGFDVSAATLSGQTGEVGFSVYAPGTTANTLVLTRAASAAAAGPVTYTLSTVRNPSAEGTYYVKLQTFAANDASGPRNDFGGIAYSINRVILVDATVPPYLLFCSGVTITAFDCDTATGSYINFGNLSSVGTSSAASQLVTATNAGLGYTMRVYGSTMTSGNNTIDALAVRDVSRPGLGQFGLNLVANSTPVVGGVPQGSGTAAVTSEYNQPDFFKFVSTDALATASQAQDYKKFTVSYIINIPTNQPVGIYATTLTYVCLANF